jgi:hypothetical protein
MPTSGSNWKTGLPVKTYNGKPGVSKCACDCGQMFVGTKGDALCPGCETKAADPAKMAQPVNPAPISYSDPAPPPPAGTCQACKGTGFVIGARPPQVCPVCQGRGVEPPVKLPEPNNAEQFAQALSIGGECLRSEQMQTEAQLAGLGMPDDSAKLAPPNGLELDLINKLNRLTQELEQVRSALGIPEGVTTLDGVNRLREKLSTARRRARGGPTYY